MTRIVLSGVVEPIHSYDLRHRLGPLTSAIRPKVVVDLTDVIALHPSAASVLVRHGRQARRQGGSLHVVAPTSTEAKRSLDRVGLVGTRR